ncbi:MAG: SH3 domain-containing protein, partial [Solobacterium sp.]|nr:SH3 domain-containing protein [Solobacterium sp.]
LNEEGISAAAVTIIGGLGAAGGLKPIPVYHDLVLDRPFIYAIVEGGVPLFIGVVSAMDGTILSGNKSVNEKLGTVDVKVDGLRVRTGPATYYDQAGNVLAGDTLTVYETTEGEGYTWYRIGVRQWIADKDGGWLDYHPD